MLRLSFQCFRIVSPGKERLKLSVPGNRGGNPLIDHRLPTRIAKVYATARWRDQIDDLVRLIMAKPANPRLARKDCLIYA
jgi:hypothetical protein